MKIYTLLVAVCFINLLHGQTTVTFNADKDNTLYSNDNSSSNGAGDNFFAGETNSGALRRALIHFDLSSIPANSTITAVTLKLYNNKQAANAAGVILHKVTADWGEGTSNAGGQEGSGTSATTGDATWTSRFYPSTAWTTAGGDYVSTPSVTVANITVGVNAISGGSMVADVQSMVNNAANNFGWIVRGSAEGTSQTSLRFGSHTHPTASQRPSITITYQAVMPVVLKTFTGTIQNNYAVLVWETASELRNHRFNIEHSTTGTEFTAIGRVNGSGTSATGARYSFTHTNVAAGTHYYRLAQYDIDGRVTYSQVVTLTAGTKASLQVYPNPAKEYININSASSIEGCKYAIVNATGKQVSTGNIAARRIDISQLAPGKYWITVTSTNERTFTGQFLKQ